MKKNKGTIVVDLDGTLCDQRSTGTYHLAEPRLNIIQIVNRLWTDGHKIVIWTARGMDTHDGYVELIEENYRDMTEKWLKDHHICYDELKFGKPSALVYVDDKALLPEDLFDWAK